jgi:hypothetical protein
VANQLCTALTIAVCSANRTACSASRTASTFVPKRGAAWAPTLADVARLGASAPPCAVTSAGAERGPSPSGASITACTVSGRSFYIAKTSEVGSHFYFLFPQRLVFYTSTRSAPPPCHVLSVNLCQHAPSSAGRELAQHPSWVGPGPGGCGVARRVECENPPRGGSRAHTPHVSAVPLSVTNMRSHTLTVSHTGRILSSTVSHELVLTLDRQTPARSLAFRSTSTSSLLLRASIRQLDLSHRTPCKRRTDF